MSKAKWLASALVLLASAGGYLALIELVPPADPRLDPSADGFVWHPFPVAEVQSPFDIGVVDANGDGRLDVYTSNHHWRQLLLEADGLGGYRDVLSAWGLDQNRDFPGLEHTATEPPFPHPGLYLYWRTDRLHLRAERVPKGAHWEATLHSAVPVQVTENHGFEVATRSPLDRPETTLVLTAQANAALVMLPRSQALPMTVTLSGGLTPDQVYVGRNGLSPASNAFSLQLQDRHAMAWADLNGDGRLDLYSNRGAVGGTLASFSEEVIRTVQDELLVSRAEGGFADRASASGINKGNCSGRHARWVDFDRDGLLDLFVNCQAGREGEARQTKQLHRQEGPGRFRDVAAEVGLEIPDHSIIDLAWLDADGDGDADLLASQSDGFYLYRNLGGRFEPQFIYPGKFVREDRPGLKHARLAYWTYDGKLSVADFDGDGDLDVFAASKKGNSLLVNESGTFSPREPDDLRLPRKSVTANWVDYDNDGLLDLHSVPQGLFRQTADHTFETRGLLGLPAGTYMAGIVNWYDLDNDGNRDVLMMLVENLSRHWWYSIYWKYFHKKRWGEDWPVLLYRNLVSGNHWLQLTLIGASGNRQAIGARVTVHTPAGQQTQEVGATEGAFFSQGHYRLYFGLGEHARAARVTVSWPDGYVQELRDVAADSVLTVERAPRPS
jgi:hypothetical protein